MNYKLKILTLIPATLIFASQSTQAQQNMDSYHSSCVMYPVSAKKSNTPRPVPSDHTVSITNSSSVAQDYHVEWQNYINFGASQPSSYSENAVKKFYVTVEPGQTKNLTEKISKDAYFSMKGTYPLKCTTNIYRDGMWVSTGEATNYAHIE